MDEDLIAYADDFGRTWVEIAAFILTMEKNFILSSLHQNKLIIEVDKSVHYIWKFL